MFLVHQSTQLGRLICINLLLASFSSLAWAITFDQVSSLANKDANNNKALLFRQIELNWINAPLDDEHDYIGLYLDSQPGENSLPVSVHKVNGQTNGQIITDYYLPQIDFYNETVGAFGQLDKHADTPAVDPPMATRLRQFHEYPIVRSSGRDNFGVLGEQCIGYCIAYHSHNKILAQNCLKTNPNWMRDTFQYIGTRSLPTLMLPGTHNSGTYPKQLDKTVLHMINKYQMNQDECIFNQLVYGIRHLDLRVGYSKVKQRPERLWIYHDIFRTEVSVDEVFEQVHRFLQLTSHEIIVMDFHRFTVGFQNENQSTQRERHAKLIDLLFRELGQYLVPSYLGQHAPINEYVAMGKRLIVGYANKASILGHQADQQSAMFGLLRDGHNKLPLRDIDAAKQDQDELMVQSPASYDNDSEPNDAEQVDRRVGTRLYNRLKSVKLISKSFSKRSISTKHTLINRTKSLKLTSSGYGEDSADQSSLNQEDLAGSSQAIGSSISRAALFFSPVRHLWPNKDSMEGLAQYMNSTTCRKYFGELRSMMAELTPTVFGAISDKYDGNRKLAQQVNRPITDWIRDRWLHCINIVSTDFFLGNDLIRLSVYANKVRILHRDVGLASDGRQCSSFRKIEHLLDKSKIPIQFAYQHHTSSPGRFGPATSLFARDADGLYSTPKDNDIITHTSSDGNQIILKPMKPNSLSSQSVQRERRDSFVENVSDGFSSLVYSFKRLLNL